MCADAMSADLLRTQRESWRSASVCRPVITGNGAGNTRIKSGRKKGCKLSFRSFFWSFCSSVHDLSLCEGSTPRDSCSAVRITGGVFLLKLLGYNFSVAVWVGFNGLFGTAVQTGVVMVIYLEDACRRKVPSAGPLTIEGLREAVMEGALLRLRPKVMTVATVVAGLLPIMWSTRTGAEVMKPLATPVLGGMVSSLLHVLIVTPVIFTTIRERELRRVATEGSADTDSST